MMHLGASKRLSLVSHVLRTHGVRSSSEPDDALASDIHLHSHGLQVRATSIMQPLRLCNIEVAAISPA